MPWYRVGTVAITAGQTTVTGTGTNFSANGRVGDAFLGPDGRWYEVTNIASGAVLSILPAYQGATASGGTYALAPMQGYVKESADRLRQLVDQFGATLAGLGAVSTENVVPVAKGGTGGTTPALARAGLQLGAASVAAILGTVSQVGGVPTGAIVERISNANGEVLKLADGTMICWRRDSSATAIAITSSSGGQFFGSASVTFPASFVGATTAVIHCSASAAALTNPAYAASVSSSGCTLFFGSAVSSTISHFISYVAVGRWY